MRIVGATIGKSIKVADTYGDVWTATWAGDDAVYAVSDDTSGFREACDSNLAVHRITGTPPHLEGVTVNPMREYDRRHGLGPDGASWKANGLTCVDGSLYLSVSRHYYFESPFWVQEAWDSSIVRSDDYGVKWTPVPQLGNAMFSGHTFGAPFFVEYGKDGWADVAGADEFVYAISSNGVWNNGSSMTLGRVRRDRIARLQAGDWEFVHGYDDRGAPMWKPRHDSARYVFRAPGRASMTGVHYIEPLRLFIMPQWHYPHLERSDPQRWQCSRWDMYQAPAPWGPWNLFHSETFEPEGFYNPSIPSKFISKDGRTLWIFAAGDFKTKRYYHLHMIPVTLEVEE